MIERCYPRYITLKRATVKKGRRHLSSILSRANKVHDSMSVRFVHGKPPPLYSKKGRSSCHGLATDKVWIITPKKRYAQGGNGMANRFLTKPRANMSAETFGPRQPNCQSCSREAAFRTSSCIIFSSLSCPIYHSRWPRNILTVVFMSQSRYAIVSTARRREVTMAVSAGDRCCNSSYQMRYVSQREGPEGNKTTTARAECRCRCVSE